MKRPTFTNQIDIYKKLTTEAVSSIYKKIRDKINDKTDSEGKRIMESKTALNRVFINDNNHCFITLKDHKPNFLNNPIIYLLNPAKNELSRITQVLLDKINLYFRNAIKVNQWRNTSGVISWFKIIKMKHNYLSNLIVKIFTLQVLTNSYQNV